MARVCTMQGVRAAAVFFFLTSVFWLPNPACAEAALPVCSPGQVLTSDGTTLSCVAPPATSGTFCGIHNLMTDYVATCHGLNPRVACPPGFTRESLTAIIGGPIVTCIKD